MREGVECPCCHQFAKVYQRKITASMARVLIRMWHVNRMGWIYLPDIRSRGQDEAIMRHWGLIEQYPDAKRPDGSSRVGWWRLTAKGRDFIFDRVTVPKYAYIYNGEKLSLDDREMVSVKDALGTRFSYAELMAGT